MADLGSYEIVRQIGEGGFGRTYEVKHKILGTKACLKQNIHVSPEDTDILLREARVLWDIHHYSLPTLRDFYECNDGSYALVMSFVEGKTLDAIVEDKAKKGKALHPENVCWITQRSLNALQYLHYHGIIHGDVKPLNIIINTKEHNAILVDYGLASVKPKADTRQEGYTPAFVPPEILDGKPPVPESDLYSLGATMIYALGGNPIGKTYPKHVPDELQKFFDNLVLHEPKNRPKWEDTDLIKELSDLRQKVFGRRQSS